MFSRRAVDYVFTGVLQHVLQRAVQGWLIHGKEGVLDVIETYTKNLETFHYRVTATAAWQLRGLQTELAETEPGSTIDAVMAERISQLALQVRDTLYAEAAHDLVFCISPKRHDVEKLLYNVGSLMRPGTFEELPALAAYDFREGGICIAFERPTAAAFHLLRGTEDVLRHYYSCAVKRDRIKKPWMWGGMTNHLRSRRTQPPRTLLDNLDSLRHNFRNPTQHPEKVYDIDEAQDLLAACVDVVNRMVRASEWNAAKSSLKANAGRPDGTSEIGASP